MGVRVAISIVLMISVIALAAPMQYIEAQDPDLGEPISLSYALDQHALQIASTENSLYVLWSDSGLIFKTSHDNGITFVDAKNPPRYSTWPQMATSGNSVYVVSIGTGPWPHQSNDIFFSASHDNGATFGSMINLADTPKWSDEPHIATSGNYVYVVWKDESSGDGDVYFRRSTDQGAGFDPIINLGALTGAAGSPRVAAEGNNVYVVWDEWIAPYGTEPRNLEVLFRASNDNGATFGPVINLSSNAGNSYYQEVAASGNNVYVVWKDSTPGNFDILFRASNDNGATFGSIINLSGNGLGAAEYPQIAATGGNVYVVWDESFRTSTGISMEVLFRASNDNGATFGNLLNLSNNAGTSQSPQIAVSENNLYIAWRDSGFPNDYHGGAFIRMSGDNGATFGNTVSTYKPETMSWEPAIAASRNSVHVVWEAFLPPSEDGADRASMILYARSPPLPVCNGLMVTIVGTENDDIIEGTLGDDVIVGLGGNDLIYGEGGNDTICGGAGNDTIDGGNGNDRILGEIGDDEIYGGADDDIIEGNNGNDTLFGGDDAGNAAPEATVNDTVASGADGNDKIKGGNGNDKIFGEIGDDTINGQGGNDTVDCGDGTDVANGAKGRDTAANCETMNKIP